MLSIAFEHPEAQPISGSFSFQIDDGWHYYFSNLELVDFHQQQDREALLLRLAKFVDAGVDRRLLRKLFKISRSTLGGRSTGSASPASTIFAISPGSPEASAR